jgi:hypothetical protein
VAVRTGLVAIGVALTVVGAGVSLAAFLEGPATSQTQLAPFSVSSLPAGAATTDVLWMQNTSSGSLEIDWVSATPMNVTFYLGGVCQMSERICPAKNAITSWTDSSVGRWTIAGVLTFPYLLNFDNVGGKRANVTGSAVETYSTGAVAPPTWAFVAELAGGISCISIGAVALYLGLFLRDGVYADPVVGPLPGDDLDDFADDDPGFPLDEPGEPPAH